MSEQNSLLTGLKAIATAPVLICAFLALRAILCAPKFTEIYDEMLRGAILPAISQFYIDNWSMIAIATSVATLVGLVFIWRTKSAAIAGIASLALSIALFAVFWLCQKALFLPLIEIINKMGEV